MTASHPTSCSVKPMANSAFRSIGGLSSLWNFAEHGPAVYVFDELAKRVTTRDLVRNVAPGKHLGVDDFFLGRGGLIDFAVLGPRRSFPNYPVILPDPCAALHHRGAN